MFRSNSQAQQDIFAYLLAGKKSTGTFLDIGSHDPIYINNTYALEQQGWTGYLFDIEPRWIEPTRKHRKSPFILADVSTFDWDTFVARENIHEIDYLSFDVDEASLRTMKRFPFDKVRFNICTIEHDSYRRGEECATAMRTIMLQHGYVIVFKDIKNDNLAYEDWYVHSSFMTPEHVAELYAESLDWRVALRSTQSYFERHNSAR